MGRHKASEAAKEAKEALAQYIAPAQFFAILGFSRHQIQSFRNRGGVYAPCRFHAHGAPRYHVEQLRLIQSVGFGALTEEEANDAWDRFRLSAAKPPLPRQAPPAPPEGPREEALPAPGPAVQDESPVARAAARPAQTGNNAPILERSKGWRHKRDIRKNCRA